MKLFQIVLIKDASTNVFCALIFSLATYLQNDKDGYSTFKQHIQQMTCIYLLTVVDQNNPIQHVGGRPSHIKIPFIKIRAGDLK